MTAVARLQAQNATALELVQRRFPNYHPVVAMGELAHREEVRQDPRLEFEIHKAVAPYCTPKLSSLEIRPPEEPSRVVVSLFEEHVLEDGRSVEVEIPLVREVSEIVPLDR